MTLSSFIRSDSSLVDWRALDTDPRNSPTPKHVSWLRSSAFVLLVYMNGFQFMCEDKKDVIVVIPNADRESGSKLSSAGKSEASPLHIEGRLGQRMGQDSLPKHRVIHT